MMQYCVIYNDVIVSLSCYEKMNQVIHESGIQENIIEQYYQELLTIVMKTVTVLSILVVMAHSLGGLYGSKREEAAAEKIAEFLNRNLSPTQFIHRWSLNIGSLTTKQNV